MNERERRLISFSTEGRRTHVTLLTEQEDGFVKVVELDEGREGQDHDYPYVDQVLGGVLVIEV